MENPNGDSIWKFWFYSFVFLAKDVEKQWVKVKEVEQGEREGQA